MEVSLVRNRLNLAIQTARDRARDRRQRTADAEREYAAFLEETAIPIARLLASALKAEKHPFSVFTPGGGLRLASDRGRNDYVEFRLEAAVDPPQVVGRISRARGSRTIDEERPVKPGVSPGEISEEDVLTFLLDALAPWLER